MRSQDVCVLILTTVLAGCDQPTLYFDFKDEDAGVDAGTDAGADAGTDAGEDCPGQCEMMAPARRSPQGARSETSEQGRFSASPGPDWGSARVVEKQSAWAPVPLAGAVAISATASF